MVKELPRVHVSAKSQEKDYLFSVKDNGIGIAPEYYNDFSRFSSAFTPERNILAQELALQSAKESLSAMADVSGLSRR